MDMIVTALGIPLAALLELCYRIFGSYGVAIVVFTALTKVILLPVSLWVHKNGIKMVQLMPELNQLKLQYYGDKDTIAEETQALYKRQGYNPLANVIPMLVQLALLMGVIGAVTSELGGSQSALTRVPAQVGGLALMMPVAAGLAALILSLAQNRLNPLQREQTVAEQILTCGLSVGISFALGGFVSIGVGIYWIWSNLLTILQQVLLNAMIKPCQYIDYEALKKSKQDLAEISSLGGGISKENKRREKADYKRFFSIANKHLVFYSEGSGFYKYFKNVIEALIKSSNVIIHYVTSDPNDQIFKIAEDQPRIKPYYIGEKKLITLMMKMDADIVVMTMPDLNKYHIKRSYIRKDIEYIYMFHYPLSTHLVLQEGALDHYDTIFCVGEFQFDEIRRTEELANLPAKKLVAVGYGQLENLQLASAQMDIVDRVRKKVLIAPSWQKGNILDSCIDELLSGLLEQDFQVVVRPHPEYVKRFGARMNAIVARYQGYQCDNLKFELDFSGNESIFNSDIVISDWSGTAYEFSFITLKPALFIDTPMKINNPNYEKIGIVPLEISLRDEIGVRLTQDEAALAGKAVAALLEGENEYKPRIKDIKEKYISNYGKSGMVAARYILDQLKERQASHRQ
ncbi:MAG: preprotein translocase YidC subunit [Oscillospiraceae bacterium]|jgi:YidC/Oxa1 family membrane protein insertase|nr:preprotein translocase YidC subunit [Oscillospiraceae bacterium]